ASERRAGAAHVHVDPRVAAGNEKFDERPRLVEDVAEWPAKGVRTVIARLVEDGGQPVAAREIARQGDGDGEPDAGGHGQVARLPPPTVEGGRGRADRPVDRRPSVARPGIPLAGGEREQGDGAEQPPGEPRARTAASRAGALAGATTADDQEGRTGPAAGGRGRWRRRARGRACSGRRERRPCSTRRASDS